MVPEFWQCIFNKLNKKTSSSALLIFVCIHHKYELNSQLELKERNYMRGREKEKEERGREKEIFPEGRNLT